MRHVIVDEALQLDRVFEQDDAIARRRDLVKQALASVVLPVLVLPAMRMFRRS